MVFHQMTRSGNDFLIDKLGTSSATKADFDTATVLLVLLALQDHRHPPSRKWQEKRIQDTERRPVEIASTNICFVDADCEAYATPLLDHFSFARCCRGKINTV